jgi:hypothetical protein
MCFSPEADIGGGLLICAIGVDAVRHIGQRREFIALAWIPVLLGAHQFIEALVWLWLQGHVPRGIGHVALWAYLLIAFVVLPVFIPLAVIALEPTRRRKQLMVPFVLIGTVVAGILLAAMVRGPVSVKLAPYHLAYSIRLSDGFLIVALYVVAVCGPTSHSSASRTSSPSSSSPGSPSPASPPCGAAGRPSPAPPSRCTAGSPSRILSAPRPDLAG